MSIDFLDFVLDSKYYCGTLNISGCNNNPKDYYLKYGLEDCSASNEFFAQNENEKYTTPKNDICIFTDYNLSHDKLDLLKDLISKDVFLKNNFNQLLKTKTKEFETIYIEFESQAKDFNKVIISYLDNIPADDITLTSSFLRHLLQKSESLDYNDFGIFFSIITKHLTKKDNSEVIPEYLEVLKKQDSSFFKRFITQANSKELEYPSEIYESFYQFFDWVEKSTDKNARNFQAQKEKILEFIIDGVNKGHYFLDFRNYDLLLTIYDTNTLGINIASQYAEKFAEDIPSYIICISTILENEPYISEDALKEILNAARYGLTLADDIKTEVLYLILRIYKQKLEFFDKIEIDDTLLAITEIKIEENLELQNVVEKVKNDLNNEIHSKPFSFEIGNDLNNVIKNHIYAQVLYVHLKHMHEELGWKKEEILAILDKINGLDKLESKDNLKRFIAAVKQIHFYNLYSTSINKYGVSLKKLLFRTDIKDVNHEIQKLYQYNNILYPQTTEKLLQEIARINNGYDRVPFLKEQLAKISFEESELFKAKEVVFTYKDSIESSDMEESKIYIVGKPSTDNINNQLTLFILKKSDDGDLRTMSYQVTQGNLDSSIIKSIENVMFYQQPFHEKYIDAINKAYLKMQIAEINTYNLNNDTLPKVLGLIKAGIKTTFNLKVRDAQVIAVLNLYQDTNGGLVQVATGEGKSIIVAMFAALRVVQTKLPVNILTSSPVLAKRDADEFAGFYASLGISSAHNIVDNEDSKKTVYQNKVVYGDTRHFIGDRLRDNTKNIMQGRIEGTFIADEADNLFISLVNMKIQLSSGFPLFDSLGLLHTRVWNLFMQYNQAIEYHDNIYYFVEPNQEICTTEKIGNVHELEKILREGISNIIKNKDLKFGGDRLSRNMTIPNHLESFIENHIEAWLTSLFQAIAYRLDTEYTIEKNYNEYSGKYAPDFIVPNDYSNTGVKLRDLKWSNALHQLIELKHRLILTTEKLTDYFMSYVDFFQSFKGHIYGLSGTLGEKQHHDFLKSVYCVHSVKIPSFIEKRNTQYPEQIIENEQEWYQSIVNSTLEEVIYKNRSALIIAETIQNAYKIKKQLLCSGIRENNIIMYTDDQDESVFKTRIHTGKVIISTNLAGRGADFKITNTLNRHNGLHVILTFLPVTQIVQNQAEGRSARTGNFGSSELIIVGTSNDTIDKLYEKRVNEEIAELNYMEHEFIPSVLYLDELFAKFLNLLKEINSATGYKIIFNQDFQGQQPENVISIFLKEGKLYMSCNQQLPTHYIFRKDINHNSESANKFEIENSLKLIAPHIYSRIIQYFNATNDGSSSLNLRQSHEEPINFIAAHLGCIKKERSQILARVEYEVYKNSALSFSQVNTIENDKNFNIELTERYKLWQNDRELYNQDRVTDQIRENWSIWLKGVNIYKTGLDNSDVNTNATHEEFKNETNNKLDVFLEDQINQYYKGTILCSPGYLTQDARYLLMLSFQDNQHLINWHIHYNKPHNSDNLPNKEIKASNQELYRKALQEFLPKAEDVLEQAMKQVRKAQQDIPFAWPARNLEPYIYVKQNSARAQDTKDAVIANEINNNFIMLLSDAARTLQEEDLSRRELQCMLLMSFMDQNSETVRQCVYSVIGMLKILDHYKNITEILKDGEGVVDIAGYEPLSNTLSSIQEADLDVHIRRFSGNSNTTNATDTEVSREEINANHSNANISNIIKLFSAQLKSKANEGEINQALLKYYKPFENDLYLKGYVGFKIYVRELEEDWTDTFIAIGIGVFTIAVGVGLMANPGFVGLLGKGLIFQGAGEIFQGLMAFAQGTPLSLDDFLKGKAIGLVVTVLTAGIAYIGAEAGWFNPETIYGKGVTDAATKATELTKVNVLASSIPVNTGITATAIIQNSFIFNIAGFLTGKAVDNYMKKNDGNIEEDIESEIKSLINSNKNLLLEMLATDIWEMEKNTISQSKIFDSLRQDANNIMQKYMKTSTTSQIGKEVVGSTINYGFGTIGGVVGGAFSAATGFNKAEDAAEIFASKFQHHINAKKDRVKTTFAMMRDGLSRSYNEQEVDFIINNITKFDNGKFGLQINYNNCSSYQEKRYFDKSLNIYEMSELKKNATSSVCERIAKVMQQAQNNQELAAFEKNLKDIMHSPIRKLYGDAAKPLVSLGFNELISLAINKFNKPKADNDNEEQKSEEKAQDKEAEKLTKQEKEQKENFDIAKKMQKAAEKARAQTETIVSDHEKRMAEKTNSCNSESSVCYRKTFGPEIPKKEIQIDSQQVGNDIIENNKIAKSSNPKLTKIAGKTALRIWTFAAENPYSAEAILTTVSIGKEVVPAAAGGCLAGLVTPVPGGCAGGATAAGGAVLRSEIRKEALTKSLSSIVDKVIPTEQLTIAINDLLSIKASLILKNSPELEPKEAYALAATTSIVAVNKLLGSIGRKEVVSNFQKFLAKGGSIIRVRGQYSKTIIRDSVHNTFDTERFIQETIQNLGKENAKN